MAFETNTLLLFGLILILGIGGARLVDRLSTPHVVGFILLGVILGDSFLKILHLARVVEWNLIADLALGFIGFGMGEHLHLSQLKTLGKSILIIAILESLGAFIAVLSGVYFVTKSLPLAIIFGSLAAATAPAATVDVLKQYKAKGPLSTTLLAVIGIDDAIALLLYSISLPLAISFLTQETSFQVSHLLSPLAEVGGSIILGIVLAFPVDFVLDRMQDMEEILLFMVASVLFVVGLAISLHLSVILTALIFGAATINLKHHYAEYVSHTIDRVGPILYILFFVLIGARLEISYLPQIGLVGISYLVFRTMGKLCGAYLGGWISQAQVKVRKYLGFALLSQAGVAVGLALSFATRVNGMGETGSMLEKTIVTSIISTTLIIQIIGPLLTKYAVFASGEATDKQGTFFG